MICKPSFPNPLVRRVAKVVDLNCTYELTHDVYCEDNGRPSVDLVVFFPMQLIGHFFGISSHRRLYEEIQPNAAYKWFFIELRQARYAGKAKTHLQHLATAAAMNLERVADWPEYSGRQRVAQ